jgi:hypothetical protein
VDGLFNREAFRGGQYVCVVGEAMLDNVWAMPE